MTLARSWCAPVVLVLLVGCAASKTSNTARTATEQLLISNAVDQSLSKIDFTPFAGRKVYVDEKYIDCVDKPYIVSSVRHRVLREGASLATKPEEADVVVELRSGGVGTSMADSFLGMPEITLPGMVTIPEVRLWSKQNQTGLAKIGLVAYDAKTNRALGEGGLSMAQSDASDWYLLGVGPYQNGSIRNEVNDSLTPRPGQVNHQIEPQVVFQQSPNSAREPVRLTDENKDQIGQIEGASGAQTPKLPQKLPPLE